MVNVSVDAFTGPSVTTSANTQLSYVNIKAPAVEADKAGLVNITFEARISGSMVLV